MTLIFCGDISVLLFWNGFYFKCKQESDSVTDNWIFCRIYRKRTAEMLKNGSSVKVTLELNQQTNLEELMANLCVMQDNIPQTSEKDCLLADFSVHEGEIALSDSALSLK